MKLKLKERGKTLTGIIWKYKEEATANTLLINPIRAGIEIASGMPILNSVGTRVLSTAYFYLGIPFLLHGREKGYEKFLDVDDNTSQKEINNYDRNVATVISTIINLGVYCITDDDPARIAINTTAGVLLNRYGAPVFLYNLHLFNDLVGKEDIKVARRRHIQNELPENKFIKNIVTKTSEKINKFEDWLESKPEQYKRNLTTAYFGISFASMVLLYSGSAFSSQEPVHNQENYNHDVKMVKLEKVESISFDKVK